MYKKWIGWDESERFSKYKRKKKRKQKVSKMTCPQIVKFVQVSRHHANPLPATKQRRQASEEQQEKLKNIMQCMRLSLEVKKQIVDN